MSSALIDFLNALKVLKRDGEWCLEDVPDGEGACSFKVEDSGRRVFLEMEKGIWCLAWFSPVGEWKIEDYHFPANNEPLFEALLVLAQAS